MKGSPFSAPSLLFVFVLLGGWLYCLTVANQGLCRRLRFVQPIEGHALQGHVIKNITLYLRAHLGSDCRNRCLMETTCVSINIGPPIKDKVICQLSDSDDMQHPEDLKPRTGFIYRGTENSCSSNPCLHNATCLNGFTDKGYLCKCQASYTGERCEKDKDECTTNTHNCHVNATCNNTKGSYHCSCKDGFHGDGKNCTDVDECSASISVCDVNAKCENTRGSYRCSCKDGSTGDGKTCTVSNKTDCAQVYKSGQRISGVYSINPDGAGAFDVFCDQTTAGGGWTVFQKRLDGSVDFYLSWAGNLTGEFWLGLDKIYRLTNSSKYKLRIDLESIEGNTGYAEFDLFAVGSEGTKYQLSVGSYTGTGGNSLANHNGYPFTTKDQDNDSRPTANCAVQYQGAWWYYGCYTSNLNGVYHHGQYSGGDGIRWHGLFSKYSAKRAEMKIRPVDF